MHPAIEVYPEALDGTAIFGGLQDQPYSFFLDSGLVHEHIGRYSFLGGDPFLVFRSRGERCSIQYLPGPTIYVQGNPLDHLQSLLRRFSSPSQGNIPFARGGAVGYFGYDLGRRLEEIPSRIPDDLGLPECYFAFYDTGIVIDHRREETCLVSTGFPLEGRRGEERLYKRHRALKKAVSRAKDRGGKQNGPGPIRGCELRSNFTYDAYCRSVEKALDYISRGDIYQVNLSQRFEARLEGSPWDLYLHLRRRNPAPFAAYLNFPGVAVVSSSPERFLLKDGSMVETRPIKGTRPRGRNPEEDRKLREELWGSQKDRAELVMIVDLERNDLSRACEQGTVTVNELFKLEAYATVYHLVSTITGNLPPDRDILDLLKVSFPGGSITGAPKIRSMEIIEELEPVRRGIYTGSIGYIDFGGRSDLNIVIRTFIISGNRACFQVGGGIVADSIPGSEYRETLDKARALMGALGFET